MLLRTLGCSGSLSPGHHSPAFLVDGGLLLDAGTISVVLGEEEQVIHTVLLTHAHLDHVKGLAHLADSLLLGGTGRSVRVVGTAATLATLSEHLFNGQLWPDFTALPAPGAGVLRWESIEPGQEMTIEGYSVTAVGVDHAVPAVGYRVQRGSVALLYTGDTGPTRQIWEHASGVAALIVEVSFPNDQEELCRQSGHLTPRLLAGELAKIPELPPRILVMHLKHPYEAQIGRELQELAVPGLEIVAEGATFSL